jgi:hypothetical protein
MSLNNRVVPPLLSENLSGEGAALTRHAVASAHTVVAHASALLLQAIITHACGAVTAVRCLRTVMVIRRAALETGGLTAMSAYLPRVSVVGPTTALNAGRWVEDPQWASCLGHAAGPAPLPPWGRHVVAPDPFPGKGNPGPRGQLEQSNLCWSSHHRWQPRTSLGSPGPRELPESSPATLGTWRPRTSKSTGKVRRPWSQLSGPGRMPHHPEGEGEITYGDTLRAWTP